MELRLNLPTLNQRWRAQLPHRRNGLVLLPVEHTSELALWKAPPLFEVERNADGLALIAKRNDPLLPNRTRSWAALASNDDPVDAVEAYRPEVFEQGLTRQKAHRDVTFLEAIQTRQTVSFVLNCHAPPNVRQIGGKLEVRDRKSTRL